MINRFESLIFNALKLSRECLDQVTGDFLPLPNQINPLQKFFNRFRVLSILQGKTSDFIQISKPR
jgi:hypothetical protein